jgi:glycosyltransferase involved in cell wall biosynthesis
MNKKDNTIKIAYVGGPDLSLRIPIIKLLRSSGYHIYGIGSNSSEKKLFNNNGILYVYYPLKRRFSIISELKSFLNLYTIFKRERFSIVHAFDTKPTIIARIAAKLAKTPIIIGTITGLGSLFSEPNILNMIIRRIYIIAQKFACKLSDMTIFQNEDDRDFFIENKISNRSKVDIIRGSGVDSKRFSSDAIDMKHIQKLKKELCIGSNLIVTMVGRLVRYKGVKEYLETAKLLKNNYGDVAFLLVGPQDKTLASFPMEELSRYSQDVKYIGARSDVREILSLSDIVVLPSYYREGIPRILLEAASMGKPIIATNIPGCMEVVENGKNGFLVPPRSTQTLAEAIKKLILNEEMRREMGVASRKIAVEKFELNIVLDKTSNIYNKLLEEHQFLISK